MSAGGPHETLIPYSNLCSNVYIYKKSITSSFFLVPMHFYFRVFTLWTQHQPTQGGQDEGFRKIYEQDAAHGDVQDWDV